MAMKKTSGGDSPLRQGAGKSFWTIPISGQRWRRIAMCFWKIDRILRFSHRGDFIGDGAASEVDQGGLTHRGRGQGLCHDPDFFQDLKFHHAFMAYYIPKSFPKF
jgi:hypothetical protein